MRVKLHLKSESEGIQLSVELISVFVLSFIISAVYLGSPGFYQAESQQVQAVSANASTSLIANRQVDTSAQALHLDHEPHAAISESQSLDALKPTDSKELNAASMGDEFNVTQALLDEDITTESVVASDNQNIRYKARSDTSLRGFTQTQGSSNFTIPVANVNSISSPATSNPVSSSDIGDIDTPSAISAVSSNTATENNYTLDRQGNIVASQDSSSLNRIEFEPIYNNPVECPPLSSFREEWRAGAEGIQRRRGCVN